MAEKRGKVKKKTQEHFSFKREYINSYNFIKSSRDYIYFIILVFFIFVVLGFFFEDLINLLFKTLFGRNLNEQILMYLQNLLLQTEGMNYKELIGFIFLNNLQSSFTGIIFGIFLGIFPLVSAVINGYLLGFVGILSVRDQGLTVLWRILPHGIFEIPAVFISLSLGLRLGTHVFFKKRKDSFRDLFINSLRIFLLIVFPLLVLAAIIEGLLIAFAP